MAVLALTGLTMIAILNIITYTKALIEYLNYPSVLMSENYTFAAKVFIFI